MIRGLISDGCVFQELMKSIELALFRPLPREDDSMLLSNGEDDILQYADPEWSHLSIVYELLLHIVLKQGDMISRYCRNRLTLRFANTTSPLPS